MKALSLILLIFLIMSPPVSGKPEKLVHISEKGFLVFEGEKDGREKLIARAKTRRTISGYPADRWRSLKYLSTLVNNHYEQVSVVVKKGQVANIPILGTVYVQNWVIVVEEGGQVLLDLKAHPNHKGRAYIETSLVIQAGKGATVFIRGIDQITPSPFINFDWKPLYHLEGEGKVLVER